MDEGRHSSSVNKGSHRNEAWLGGRLATGSNHKSTYTHQLEYLASLGSQDSAILRVCPRLGRARRP